MIMSPDKVSYERDRLHNALINLSYDEDGCILSPDMIPHATRQAALDLAVCIVGTESDQCYALEWMLIYEALGEIEKAEQVGERDLKRRINDIRDGEYDEYPKLLVEYVDMMQMSADFQAQRLWMLGRRDDSLHCITDAIELASTHNVPLNKDILSLLDHLLENKKRCQTNK